MRIIEEEQLDFDDVLIQPKCSKILSRSEVNLMREFKWYDVDNTKKFTMTCIPYGTTNMGTVGVCSVAEKMVKSGHIACLEKHIPYEDIDMLFSHLSEEEQARAIPSIGIKEDCSTIEKLYDKWHLRLVMVDVPNGYIPSLVNRVKEIHQHCKDMCIIAGNVVDAAGAAQLMDAGVKIVKSGIGNGSVCLTRLKTGVGRPQLSTLIEVADACHQRGCYVMSDGGVNSAGDVCKAFGAGADFVISGSLFAGCDEAEGETISKWYKSNTVDRECSGCKVSYYPIYVEKKFKQYYGMSSHLAQEKHFGGVRSYSASEGREKLIPCTGPLESVLNDIDGGLKSCCTYIGCTKMKNFSRHTTFYKVRRQLNTKFDVCQDISK